MNSAARPLARGRTLTPLAPACARYGIMIHNRPEFTQPRVKTHWELGVARGSECSARPENGCAVRAPSKNHEVSYASRRAIGRAARGTTRGCRPHRRSSPLGTENARANDRPERDPANKLPRSRARGHALVTSRRDSGGLRSAVPHAAMRNFSAAIGPSDTFRGTNAGQRARGLRW